MPRYFFNLRDGAYHPDHDGTELPDLASARAVAVRFSGEILREMSASFWEASEWRLEVCDEEGSVVVVLRFLADERPVPTNGTAAGVQATA